MATNVTRTQQSGGAAPAAALAKEAAAMAKETAARRVASDAASDLKPTGYGLPCAKCHLYYPANLDICPTCKHNQRVAAVTPKFPARPAQAAAEPIPDSAVVEREREEFLRQFKSQLMEAHAEVARGSDAACKFGELHVADPASAEICTSCYERLQERADVCEAALHMDLKEAAQIIYDAVWADPSDPGKTYQNAASALLTELRKRAGISTLMSPFQPLEN
jgi:hypothetical protein